MQISKRIAIVVGSIQIVSTIRTHCSYWYTQAIICSQNLLSCQQATLLSPPYQHMATYSQNINHSISLPRLSPHLRHSSFQLISSFTTSSLSPLPCSSCPLNCSTLTRHLFSPLLKIKFRSLFCSLISQAHSSLLWVSMKAKISRWPFMKLLINTFNLFGSVCEISLLFFSTHFSTCFVKIQLYFLFKKVPGEEIFRDCGLLTNRDSAFLVFGC